MTDKPVLFLDTDFLQNVWGRDVGSADRFNRIMDGFAEQYDIRITDVVKRESVENISFPKDQAIDNWLNDNRVTPIGTTVVTGPDAGEKSIVEAIKNDADLYDTATNTPKAGTFEIASNDQNFFNSSHPEGGKFTEFTEGAQGRVKASTINGHTTFGDYKDLSTNGSASLKDWTDYKDVNVEALKNKNGLNIHYDSNGNYIVEYDNGSTLKVTEDQLLGGGNTMDATLDAGDGTPPKTISLKAKVVNGVVDALDTFGTPAVKVGLFIVTVDTVGTLMFGSAQAYAAGDDALGDELNARAGDILADLLVTESGGLVGSTLAGTIALGILALPGITVGAAVGTVIVVLASVAGAVWGEIGAQILEVNGIINLDGLKESLFDFIKHLFDALSWGDPHLVTFDNLAYDFQDRGEFTLVESTDEAMPFEVQVRHEDWNGSSNVSVNTAVATEFGDTKVSIHLAGSIDVAGTANADYLVGTNGADSIDGQAGADTIFGGAGDDILAGGAGNDALKGSAGDDEISGGDGDDQAHFSGIFGNYTITQDATTLSYTTVDNVGIDGTDVVAIDVEKLVFSNGIFENGTFSPYATGGGHLLIADEDFEGGATGWSNNTTTATEPTYTEFLGRFGRGAEVSKNFTLSGDQTEVTIEFDFYRIDSWDGENFNIMLDGEIAVSESFGFTFDTPPASGSFANGTWTRTSELDGHLGFNTQYRDQNHHYTITYNTSDSDFDLSFSSSLGQSLGDESWGLDNLVITSNGTASGGGTTERIVLDDPSGPTVLYLNDAPVDMADGKLLAVGGGIIYRDGHKYTVITEHGDGFVASVNARGYIDVSPFLSENRDAGTVRGLLGNNDGDRSNEFTLADGTSLGANISANSLYNVFGEELRIAQAESLFTYNDGENTNTFLDPNFSDQYTTLADFDPAIVAAARAQAIAAGFDETTIIFDAIVYDFVLGLEAENTSIAAEVATDDTIELATIENNPANDIIVGTTGADSLVGTANDNQIIGRDGNDTITSGAGADVILMTREAGASDVITDFEVGVDVINLTHESFAGLAFFADLSITQDGADAVIQLGDGHTLRLQNVDATLLTDADFDGIAENDVLPSINELLGTTGRDILTGTPANDVISSLGGSIDRMSGGDGADIFAVGAEANNGIRERDIILDYEVGIDAIQLEDGASVGSIRQTSSGVAVFLEGDNDAIYVQGEAVIVGSLDFIPENIALAS